MKEILLAVVVGLWATASIAHSPLEATTPADKSIVTEMPLEVFLNFKNTRIICHYLKKMRQRY